MGDGHPGLDGGTGDGGVGLLVWAIHRLLGLHCKKKEPHNVKKKDCTKNTCLFSIQLFDQSFVM